ncbi:hypothetical protein ACIRBY_24775 [Streptomyces sp. NPDC096136]|uniref:hypothetical protein n=1 Tax=Streptomyces sp. NPDC096136 TaxID=3366076 RepID=UPI00380F4836
MRRMRANAFIVEPPGDDEHHIWGDLVVRRFYTHHRGYHVKLRVGWFAVQIISIRVPPAHEVGLLSRTPRTERLWPMQPGQFAWPPPVALPYESWVAMQPTEIAVWKRPA